MWVQIVLSLLLAVVAVRVIVYAARHDVVPTIPAGDDFVVRMPRVFFLVGIVLLILAGSFTLSIVVWNSANVLSISGVAAVGAFGLWFVLRGAVWKVDVRQKYLIFVSMLGIKHLVHYEDVESARLSDKCLRIKATLRTYKVSTRAVYLENLLAKLAEKNVPLHLD